MLAILMGAMLVFLIAQAPGHARAAQLDPSVPLGGRMAGALVAVLFMMPLVAYAVAWLVGLLANTCGWKISGADSRLALFWALFAIAPAMLLSGLVEGLIGPGTALTVSRSIAGLGFFLIWGAGFRTLARRS